MVEATADRTPNVKDRQGGSDATTVVPATAPPAVVAGFVLQSTGGDDIATRVDVFEEIYLFFLALGTLVGIVVVSYMLHKAYKYRAGAGHEYDVDRPQLGELPTGADKGGRKLFLSFFLSAIIVISLVGWTYGWLVYVETGAAEVPEDGLEVEVVGDNFAWGFEYQTDGLLEGDEERLPQDEIDDAVDDLGEQAVLDALEATDGDADAFDEALAAQYEESDLDADDQRSADDIETNYRQVGQFNVPTDREVHIRVTAADVWHAFGIPEFRVKADAIPAETTETWFVAEETGDFNAECFELCGSGHTGMEAGVTAMSQEEFQAWHDEQTITISEAIEQIEAGAYADEDDADANGTDDSNDAAAPTGAGLA